MSIAFTFDQGGNVAKSSDPEIYVERLTISKEEVHAFCLHWHQRKIVITATVVVTGSLPARRHDWTITGVGKIHPYMPAYHFSTMSEMQQAADLALNALNVMPWMRFKGEEPAISATLSRKLQAILSDAPEQRAALNHDNESLA
jgi:hypothetical protein